MANGSNSSGWTLRWSGAGAHSAPRRARRAALVSSCKEKAKREILEVFTYFMVHYRKDKSRLFLELDTNGTRDNGHVAKMQTLVVPYEDGQRPRGTVRSLSLEAFKTQ